MEKKKRISKDKKINIYKILTILLSIALLVVVGVMAHSWMVTRQAQAEYDRLAEKVNSLQDQLDDNRIEVPEETQTETQTETQASSESLPVPEETESTEENSLTQLGIDPPVKNLDWEALGQVNPDIYAWICIPGTQVDYPILQHPSDDSYYRKYNMNGTRGYQ